MTILWACWPPSEEIRLKTFRDENIVNIDNTFGNLRPNKYPRRNDDTVELRTFAYMNDGSPTDANKSAFLSKCDEDLIKKIIKKIWGKHRIILANTW